jgi:hypothetical protein
MQGNSKVPPELPNSAAQQPRQTQQKGAYQQVENLSKFLCVLGATDMLPFGVTIPATVPQRSEIPEGLLNYPVYISQYTNNQLWLFYYCIL